jgi:hypothetical protein
MDFDANRASITSGSLAQYRIVHLATHGILNSDNPEFSGIVLSLVNQKGQEQAGFVDLSEIYNLKLSAELVVLCGECLSNCTRKRDQGRGIDRLDARFHACRSAACRSKFVAGGRRGNGESHARVL